MADEAPRRTWRTHPLIKRLVLIGIVAVGLWLWKATDVPERQLIYRLEGDDWGDVRAMDLQVLDEQEHIVKREERFFADGPPMEVSFKLDLPEGTFRTLLFLQVEGREKRDVIRGRLMVGEALAIVVPLRLPAPSR
ncbi:hypothetical protein D7X55_11165 [Corallococcus sp. AB049A]|uniref:Uncharacterized protein n=1 Tax=Corallococcus interemptor TaxID=2316720 RepID=A0A3A8Q9E6_9BACT|nr:MULTISPECIES: hypothetical protein [Corallococcus]RKH43564.1 hypothetical protein D7Y23_29005 [Corallococcus sp. AB050B]RKH62825.1 hypothetical protein D7X96_28995 [Corallococcus interemptor]RKI69542.1 hypothetical protein D7X55_11165 [Corallococcus sp. AB049A]